MEIIFVAVAKHFCATTKVLVGCAALCGACIEGGREVVVPIHARHQNRLASTRPQCKRCFVSSTTSLHRRRRQQQRLLFLAREETVEHTAHPVVQLKMSRGGAAADNGAAKTPSLTEFKLSAHNLVLEVRRCCSDAHPSNQAQHARTNNAPSFFFIAFLSSSFLSSLSPLILYFFFHFHSHIRAVLASRYRMNT